jgi:hypothetical protein
MFRKIWGGISGSNAIITGGTIDGTTIGATTPSTVSGYAVVTTHSATENVTAVTMGGNLHVVTGAYVLSLPTAAVGYRARFKASTAAVYSLDVVTGSDVIILNGTALTAGNKATSDGTIYNTMEVCCFIANKYDIISLIGLAVDGGA